MVDDRAPASEAKGRPRSVAITGWFFFGIACWMTLSVFSYLAVSGILRSPSTMMPAGMTSVWSVIAVVEAVLGPLMIVTSQRFLKLRRWTRIPLLGFGMILVLGTIAFGGFWVFQMSGFFSEMRSGPELDAIGSVVARVFPVIMTIGGIAVSLTFAIGFGLLVKQLRTEEVRQCVTKPGF